MSSNITTSGDEETEDVDETEGARFVLSASSADVGGGAESENPFHIGFFGALKAQVDFKATGRPAARAHNFRERGPRI